MTNNTKAARQEAEGAREGTVLESVPIERIEQYLNGKYDFRRNEVTNRVEYKLKTQESYRVINENALNSLWRELTKARQPCSITTLWNLLKSDYSPAYDPFIHYIHHLPEWNGEPDYIDQLADTVVTNNQEFWKICLKKWLVAMVGSWVDPSVTNQTALVFAGGQGIGKTTWINNLVPPALKSYYYSGTINPNDKDTVIQLAECAIINLDELENLNRSEIGALKEIITKSVIRLRRPYAIDSENYVRRASFAGSVNASQFLNDATGSRRFLCFEVLEFVRDHSINIDNVLSQAITLFQSGYQYWFDQQEIAQVEKNNLPYQVSSIEEDLLKQHFEPTGPDDSNCQFLAATEVGRLLQTEFKVPMDQGKINRLGKTMHRLGYKQVKRQNLYKYCVKRKTAEYTAEQLFTMTTTV